LPDYALVFKLLSYCDLGVYQGMQKIQETICMWQDCLLGSPRGNWRSILLPREK